MFSNPNKIFFQSNHYHKISFPENAGSVHPVAQYVSKYAPYLISNVVSYDKLNLILSSDRSRVRALTGSYERPSQICYKLPLCLARMC